MDLLIDKRGRAVEFERGKKQTEREKANGEETQRKSVDIHRFIHVLFFTDMHAVCFYM